MKQFIQAENIELVYSGKNYFDLLEKIIDESKQVLHFQTYIFETDNTGIKIISALKRAAARGVKVYLMIDAFGSVSFAGSVIKELEVAGIHFRKYSPLFSSESIYFGRRMHYKIIVADKTTAVTGGINVADKYNTSQDVHPWLDYAVHTTGNVCEYLHILCETAYHKKNSRTLKTWERSALCKNDSNEKLVSFKLNDWLKRKHEIYSSYLTAIKNAKTSITIISSYFLPGITFRKLLVMASKRGVEVKIILAGKSDVSSVRLAETYLYEYYLKNNIQIFEWGNSVMHGKAMIVDDKWTTIGSYNINFLSRFISIELNTDIRDTDLSAKFKTHINEIISSGCKKIEGNDLQLKKNWLFNLKMWVAYHFYSLLMDVVVNKRGRKAKV